MSAATFEQLAALPQEQAFDAMGKVQEEDVPLLAGSLMVARDEYPELDASAIEQLARSYATRAEALGASADAPMAAMRVINTLLFEELGFTGNTGDYYDPRNSYVNDVFERKLGIPISLAVIQLDLARRLGLPLEGVSFPGHFLVRLPVDGGLLVLDPFHKGRSLDADELKQRARPHFGNAEIRDDQLGTLLAPVGTKTILGRMLRNLKSVYAEKEDIERALRCSDRLIRLDPAEAGEWRDRGQFYLKVGHVAAARADFAHYLELSPDAADADQVRQSLIQASGTAARLN